MAITTWTTVTAGDDSVEAPFRTRHAAALRQRLMHVQESVYDSAVHTPHEDRPHDHCGKCSPQLPTTAVPNLLLGGLGIRSWTTSGATQSASTGTSFTAGSQYAVERILSAYGSRSVDAAASLQVFGAGCPLVLAILARKVGTVTAATLEFGLADSTAYATGAKASLDVSALTTTFKRFYTKLSNFSASSHSTDCSVKLSTAAAWTGSGSIQTTLIMLRPGTGLSYWLPGHMEVYHLAGYETASGPATLYDQSRDFIDATELTPS